VEEIRERLSKVISKLRQREIDIITLRFGLNGNPEMTLQEIADVYGVTRGRIEQILSATMKKLRKPKINKEIRRYINVDKTL